MIVALSQSDTPVRKLLAENKPLKNETNPLSRLGSAAGWLASLLTISPHRFRRIQM